MPSDLLPPALVATLTYQRGIITAAQALDAGLTRAEIRSALASGGLVRLRRGIYTTADWWQSASRERQHLAVARGVQMSWAVRSVVSHRSAALAHGLPIIGDPPPHPELTVQRENRCTTSGVHLYTARLFRGHTVGVDGLACTTVARTISDIARAQPLHHAVAAGDHALRHGLLPEADVDRVLRDCWTWRGIARTKRVLAMIDGGAESPGESVSRLVLTQNGLAPDELQREIRIGGRSFRSDFWWRSPTGPGVIGEFDGFVKYNGASGQVLFDEKLREDALRDAGYVVVRWIWPEMWGSEPVMVERVRRALAGTARGMTARMVG